MATLPKTYSQLEQQMKRCIELCQRCHNVCVGLVDSQSTGDRLSEALLRVLQDCAEICQTSTNFLLRGSKFHAQICGVCAEICLQCAAACEEFPTNSRMKEGAEICRQCAESCQMMMAIAVSK